MIEMLETDADLRRRRVALSDGSGAVASNTRDGEVLQVHAPTGEVVFEYHAATGKSRILVPQGDLELVAQQGDIDLVSGRHIRLTAQQGVEIRTPGALRLAVSDALGRIASSLRMTGTETRVQSGHIKVTGRRGDVSLERARYRGQRLDSCIAEVRAVAGRLESVVGTLIEKAKDAYRKVEGLSQLRAGRTRTLVDGTCHLKAGRANLKAEKEFKVDGSTIHLG